MEYRTGRAFTEVGGPPPSPLSRSPPPPASPWQRAGPRPSGLRGSAARAHLGDVRGSDDAARVVAHSEPHLGEAQGQGEVRGLMRLSGGRTVASRFRVRVRAGRSTLASARKAAAPPTIIRSDTPKLPVLLTSPHASPDGTTTACGRRASASAASGGAAMKSVSRRTRAYVMYERLPRAQEGGKRAARGR